MISFPQELIPEIYRELNTDLSDFDDEQLLVHLNNFGKQEGRVSNTIFSRADFVALLPQSGSVLEIGPFYSPVAKGPNVKYFDVLSTQELISRAQALNIDYSNVPGINFVDRYGNLGIIQEEFDFIVSSHSIQYQHDFIDHLANIEKLLKPGGYYFILCPDKRYIFDHFIPETTIADILSKHLLKVTSHSLKSVIEHRAMTTHNDPVRHWAGDHGSPYDDFANRARHAIQEYMDAQGRYIDVHASFFTPDSFATIIERLRELKLTNLSIVRNYHTPRNQSEFFIIMAKNSV